MDSLSLCMMFSFISPVSVLASHPDLFTSLITKLCNLRRHLWISTIYKYSMKTKIWFWNTQYKEMSDCILLLYPIIHPKAVLPVSPNKRTATKLSLASAPPAGQRGEMTDPRPHHLLDFLQGNCPNTCSSLSSFNIHSSVKPLSDDAFLTYLSP